MNLKKELYARAFLLGKSWKVAVQKNGVRKSFYSSLAGDVGRKECVSKAIEWLSAEKTSTVTNTTTVDSVYRNYLKDKALETTNIYTITNRYNNHIKPIIGCKKVLNLTVQDLKRVITTAHQQAHLSKKTLTNLRGDLSGFCNYLYDSGIRYDLNTKRIKIPASSPDPDKKTLTPRDISILFFIDTTLYDGKIQDDDMVQAYRFQLATGLRPGELMGLQWGDIHDDFFRVCRAITAKGEKTNGKNKFARRDFPLTRHLKDILRCQEKYRTYPNDPTERIFGDMGQIGYRKRWSIYCATNNIPYVTPYELRHTFASIYKMLPVWILDELMGHVHAGVSLGIYAHSMAGDMDSVAETLDSTLDQILLRGKAEFDTEIKPA